MIPYSLIICFTSYVLKAKKKKTKQKQQTNKSKKKKNPQNKKKNQKKTPTTFTTTTSLHYYLRKMLTFGPYFASNSFASSMLFSVTWHLQCWRFSVSWWWVDLWISGRQQHWWWLPVSPGCWCKVASLVILGNRTTMDFLLRDFLKMSLTWTPTEPWMTM